MAAQRFDAVYGVFVWCPTDFLVPGVVRIWCAPTSGILHVGRYPSGRDSTAAEVSGAFRASTFYSEAKPEIMRWKYRKLLSNLGNAVEALCGIAARGSGIAQRARREALSVTLRPDFRRSRTRRESAAPSGTCGANDRRRRRQVGSSWPSLERRTDRLKPTISWKIVLMAAASRCPTPVTAPFSISRSAWPLNGHRHDQPDKILSRLDCE